MINVSKKGPTIRTALAECIIEMNKEAFAKLKTWSLEKGDAI